MGQIFSSDTKKNTDPLPLRQIFVTGLDAAGKSSLLYKLYPTNVTTTIPSIGETNIVPSNFD